MIFCAVCALYACVLYACVCLCACMHGVCVLDVVHMCTYAYMVHITENFQLYVRMSVRHLRVQINLQLLVRA